MREGDGMRRSRIDGLEAKVQVKQEPGEYDAGQQQRRTGEKVLKPDQQAQEQRRGRIGQTSWPI